MSRAMRQDAERPSGQALVEFALVLPVLLLILFGIVDAGRLIYTYNAVANAARDGARVAIVNQSTSGTKTCDTTSATAWPVGCAVVSGINLAIAQSDVQVDYVDPSNPNNACTALAIGCLARVKVTGHYQALTPIIAQIIGPVAVTSTSIVPVERVCSNPPPSPLTNC